MFPGKCCFIWPNGYKGEFFLEIDQPETRIAWLPSVPCLLQISTKWAILIEDLHIVPSFSSFGQVVSEEKIFRYRPTRNKNCLWWPCLLMDQDKIGNLYTGSSIDASCQVSVHLAMRFQRTRFFYMTKQQEQLSMVAMFANGSKQNEQT